MPTQTVVTMDLGPWEPALVLITLVLAALICLAIMGIVFETVIWSTNWIGDKLRELSRNAKHGDQD